MAPHYLQYVENCLQKCPLCIYLFAWFPLRIRTCFFPVTSVTRSVRSYKSAFKRKHNSHPAISARGGGSDRKHLGSLFILFYLLFSKAVFIVVTGDKLELCDCLQSCRGRACRAAGSPDWCWEVTAFMFRHTLRGPSLSLLSISRNTNSSTHTHTHTRTHTVFGHVLLMMSQRRRTESVMRAAGRSWPRAWGSRPACESAPTQTDVANVFLNKWDSSVPSGKEEEKHTANFVLAKGN